MNADMHGDKAIEEQIEQWRNYVRRRQAVQAVDVAKLEHQLREES